MKDVKNKIEIKVEKSVIPQRIDLYLSHHQKCSDLSRARIQALISENFITLNGKKVKSSFILQGEETILVEIPQVKILEAVPENIPLDIIYQDKDVVVINKPAGLTVHPSATQKNHTLVNALLNHVQDLSGIGGVLRPGIVHRLDKDTSGVLIAAKNDQSHWHLAEQFKNRVVKKIYWAFVYGHPPQTGEWNQKIGRHPTQRKKFSVLENSGKEALTRYNVLKYFEKCALLEIELLTGRTHQIRVHAKAAGFSLIGDKTYKNSNFPKNIKNKTIREYLETFNRQALHAYTLRLKLPNGRTKTFKAALPEDLIKLQKTLSINS